MSILGFVMEPLYDPAAGEDPVFKVFMTSCVDIHGQVPKFLCNVS